MTPATLAHIRADVQTAMIENRNDDPALLPDLVAYLLTELGKVATCVHHPASCACWACASDAWTTGAAGAVEELLERVQLRAVSQIPMADADACDQRDYDTEHDWRDR